MTNNAEARGAERAGKYLTFRLAAEDYGLEILKVREIIGMMDITAVPRVPAFVKGVINLRGKVIPVVDLREKFGMEAVEHTEETCIIVVDVGTVEMGIIVDKVSEVLDIPGEDIQDTPALGTDVNTDFILGIGKPGGRVKILLDIDNVLSVGDVCDLSMVADGVREKGMKQSNSDR
jgi:purine-binding chemotaxis protein CheW